MDARWKYYALIKETRVHSSPVVAGNWKKSPLLVS